MRRVGLLISMLAACSSGGGVQSKLQLSEMTVVASPANGGSVQIFNDPIPVSGEDGVTPTRNSVGTFDSETGCTSGDTVVWFLEATPADGYVFDHWGSPCGSQTSDTYEELPCEHNYTCTAYFVPIDTTDGSVPPPDAGSSMTSSAPALSLSGDWKFVQDGNQNNPAPVMTLNGASAEQVTVSYNGRDGQQCDCNAEHLVIPLGKTIQCSTGTLEFDYHTSGSFGNTSSSALSIRFCTGSCSEAGFYGGAQFIGSEQAGHSNCAIPFGNNFPSAPQVHEGHNVISLSSLSGSLNGSCSGGFDTIDVHMQGYACFQMTDTGTSTLANLKLY